MFVNAKEEKIIEKAIERERKTVYVMIKMYCRDHHNYKGKLICKECRDLLKYVYIRVEKCPLRKRKPTCDTCPIHCYKPEYREKIRKVMRYSGPRMIKEHPIMAIRHLIDRRKSKKMYPNEASS